MKGKYPGNLPHLLNIKFMKITDYQLQQKYYYLVQRIAACKDFTFSVDESNPITLNEFINGNSDNGVLMIDEDWLSQILSLEIGETFDPIMGAAVKRIS